MTSSAKTEQMIRDAVRDSEELAPLTGLDIPLRPMFWSIVVEPLMPKKKTQAGLYIADEAQKVEKIQNTIGRVLAIGDLAFKGKTESGLQLREDKYAADMKEGDFVLFARYTGQTVNFKKDGHDRTIILLSDTELLAIVDDPSVIRFWL